MPDRLLARHNTKNLSLVDTERPGRRRSGSSLTSVSSRLTVDCAAVPSGELAEPSVGRFPNRKIVQSPACVCLLLAQSGRIPPCEPECLQVGRTLPGLFHVADRGTESPAQRPVKVADRHRGRAADTLGAVEVHRAARRDQGGQGADAPRELLPKL